MAEILQPRPREDAYDYACGSAGLLIKLQLIAEKLDPVAKKLPLRLHGQELQGSSYAIAWMNVIIHDLQAEIVRGDSMRNPKFRATDGTRLRQFPLIIANPMWNQTFDPDVFENDGFDRFERQGGNTSGKGDWAWLQHTAACLADGGRAAIVLDTGAVSRGSGSKNEDKERALRKWFVEQLPWFLFQWFQRFDLRTITEPGPTPQLNKKNLTPLFLPVPPEAEQREIAGLLATLDAKIAQHEARQGLLRELFRTLLHDLLTARRRVTSLHLADLSIAP